MRKLIRIAAVGLVSLGLLAPSAAMAKEGDVIRTGICDAGSTWKLKLSPDDPAMIEVEFQVDENIAGHTWRVRLVQDGELVFRGARITKAPSGSFTLRRLLPDTLGQDIIRARAFNPLTGEVCIARAVLNG